MRNATLKPPFLFYFQFVNSLSKYLFFSDEGEGEEGEGEEDEGEEDEGEEDEGEDGE